MTLQALEEIARQVDAHLVLAVVVEVADAGVEYDDAALRRIVALTLAHAGVPEAVEVSLLITDDGGLRNLNREYRGRDEVTDVLSFPLLDEPLADAPEDQLWQGDAVEEGDLPEDEGITDEVMSSLYATDLEDEDDDDDNDIAMPFLTPEDTMLHLGDIAISRDAVQRQAQQAGHSATWEFSFLLSHGVLHLIGYDDHTEAGYRAMVRLQEAVLCKAAVARESTSGDEPGAI